MRPQEMNIRRVVLCIPGDRPAGDKLVKLSTNEDPYPSAPGVEWALGEVDADRLRKYPDLSSTELVTALVEYYGVREGQVFVGVSSGGVIIMSFLTFFSSQRSALFPDITYSFHKVWVDLYQIPYETSALSGDTTIRSPDYKRENGGVTFPNPNAPTGLYMLLDRMEEAVKTSQNIIVIVDEAYIDFVGPSVRELLPGYDNLLVAQTFSKSRSMAGVCIGLALGSPTLIKTLNGVKYSYNSYTMDLPFQIAGIQAVKDRMYSEETRAKIITTRERLKKRFAELGPTFPDSMTSFIPVTHKHVPARAIFDALKEEQIHVHYFNAPRFNNSLRVGIGMGEEMDVLFRFLEEHLKGWKPAGDSE